MFRSRFFTPLLALVLAVGFGPFAVAQTPAIATNNVGAQAIGPIATTVSDMDLSLRFYTEVLSFEKVSDFSVSGRAYEQLFGVSDAKARIARIRLGQETLDLIQFSNTGGRPVPYDSRSNDRWFQHVAIIVSDMDRAYSLLRKNKVE